MGEFYVREGRAPEMNENSIFTLKKLGIMPIFLLVLCEDFLFLNYRGGGGVKPLPGHTSLNTLA